MKPDEAFVSVLALIALVGFLAYFIRRVWTTEFVGSLRASEIDQGGPGWIKLSVRRSVYGPAGLRRVLVLMGTPWYPWWSITLNQIEAEKLAEILETAAGESDRHG